MTGILGEPTFEQVMVQRLRVGATNYVQRNVVLETSQAYDLFDHMMVALRSEVLAQSLDTKTYTHTHTEKFPSSPWQFFKERHATSWWLRWLVERRPVRYEAKIHTEDIDVEQLFAYPDAHIALPEDRFGAPYLIHRVLP